MQEELTGKSEKSRPQRQVQGVGLGQAALAQCSLGGKSCGDPQSLGDACLWGEGREGMARAAPQRESAGWGLCFVAFISLWQEGILGEFSGGGFQQNIHQFSRCALSGSWSPRTGQRPGGGSLVIEAGPGIAHLVWLLFWVWSGTTAEAWMFSLGRWPPVSGCKLLRAVFSCLSFPVPCSQLLTTLPQYYLCTRQFIIKISTQENMFAKGSSDEGLLSKIYEELSKVSH